MNDNTLKVIEVEVNDILPNRFQPRIQFDETEILELSDSIKEHGVIQPIVVRTIGDKYEIIAGERRYKASVLAGKDTVPVIIKNLNDKESAEVALIENVQRKNLTPIEEAISYKKILDMGYLKQEDLANKLGKSQSSVANKIRLLNLSDEVQEALLENKISERHARSLLKLSTTKLQNEMLDRIINERLTVRKTDEEIEKIKLIKNKDKEETIEERGENNMNNEQNFNSIPEMPNFGAFGYQNDNINSNLTQPNFNFNSDENTNIQQSSINLDQSMNNNVGYNNVQNNTFEPLTVPSFNISSNNNELTQPNFNFNSDENTNIQQSSINLDQSMNNNVEYNNVQNNTFESSTVPSFDIFNSYNVDNSSNQIIDQNSTISSVPSTSPILDHTPSMVQESDNLFSFSPQQAVQNNIQTEENNNVEINEYSPLPSSNPTSEPIIITDYNKQYDPIMPESNNVQISKTDFRDVINAIRECSNKIEQYGYKIDVEEYDLSNIYQVVFKIEK